MEGKYTDFDREVIERLARIETMVDSKLKFHGWMLKGISMLMIAYVVKGILRGIL